MKSPLYYAVMIGLIIALVIVLILLIRKRKREEKLIREYQEKMNKLRADRQAEAENTRKHYSTYNESENQHIPRYAAGDDMDRLQHRPKQCIPTDTLYAIIAIALLFCLKLIAKIT